MVIQFNLFGTTLFSRLLLLQGASGGGELVSTSLTPLGWIVVIVTPLALISGIICLIFNFLKKPKLK